MHTWEVIFLGWIEGLTEYLPVSSTAHLLLTERLLGVSSPGRTFEVLIQLGAILALLTVYSAKLLQIAIDLPRDPRTQRFVLAVLIAFLSLAKRPPSLRPREGVHQLKSLVEVRLRFGVR